MEVSVYFGSPAQRICSVEAPGSFRCLWRVSATGLFVVRTQIGPFTIAGLLHSVTPPQALPLQGMQAVTLGVTNLNNIGMSVAPPGNPAAMDPAQLEQLMQLLGHKPAAAPAAMGPPKQTAVVECPKSMVGRVIGKGGETIKSLQQYTGAMIQIDQSTDPTRVTIAGSPQSLQLAVSMVSDIVRGTFKGFAMLRQIAVATGPQGVLSGFGQPQPVYVQGYGFVPPSQVFNPEDPMSASLMQGAAPTGPLTPPITPLRTTAANNLAGGLPPDTLAALLGSQAAAQPQMMQQASNNPQQGACVAFNYSASPLRLTVLPRYHLVP